ncbi:MAG: DUF2723 domain-containing protein [Patescibacteria group bacterium]|nr:DUF2723 domain-containing protein [Patescibacteria group bacterium]
MTIGGFTISSIVLSIAYLFVFFIFQTHGISGGDSGDLVTAAVTGGVPHPPGYPLYTLLGFFLNKLPLFTPAWRVSLLSSLFHSASIVLIFLISFVLTKKYLSAFFSALTIGGTYVFFYYSITPEVFALFSFFLLCIIFLYFLWIQTRRMVYFYLCVFVFFLSLSHHHLILFVVPSLILGILVSRQYKKLIKSINIPSIILLAIIGLMPYIYVPLAGKNNSIIYWNNPETVRGFFRLVTRADYGIFQSSAVYGDLPTQRLLSVKAYLQFVFGDFSIIGVVLFFLGFLYIFKKQRIEAIVLGCSLLCFGPIFFFYASFPIISNFTLGIYERFLLPSYLIIALCIGFGAVVIFEFLQKVLFFLIKNRFLRGITTILLTGCLFLYPLRLFYKTSSISQGLSHDTTADTFGRDMLRHVKPNAIVILSGDTSLFIAQYVRYALGFRSDTKVLHANGLLNEEYPVVVHKVFPDLATSTKRGADFFQDFIRGNIDRFPIYANETHPIPDGMFWVPKGLLYELTKESDLPSLEGLAKENAMIFSSYQNPFDGVLHRYRHLMLADIPEVYAESAYGLGTTFLRGGNLEEAKKYFSLAVDLSDERIKAESYLSLGIVYFLQDKCQESLGFLEKSKEYDQQKDRPSRIRYEIAVYKECFKDEQKAEEIRKRYEHVLKQGTPLRQWQ